MSIIMRKSEEYSDGEPEEIWWMMEYIWAQG
jgi:hypothetical protein